MGEKSQKLWNGLAKAGELIAAGGLSTRSRERESEQLPKLSEVRGRFITDEYPKIFGREEMGDPSREINPEELTQVLIGYEAHLAINGLLATSGQRIETDY